MGNFGILLPPKLFLRISMLLFLVVHNANSQYVEGSRRLKPCELESLLRDLTYPEEGYEMHAAALRSQLRHILERDPTDGGYQSLDEYGSYDNSGPYEDKRSYRSLLREGPPFYKRNLGSLARSGLLRTPSSDYLKRSIATLAKNGQLPASREPDSSEASTTGGWIDEKRNLASARASGYMLNGKRNIASLARKYELPGKRNIQSLLRTGMLPSIAPKRNMQSLARDNAIPHYAGPQESKRNIQTLVRDWNLPRQQSMGSEKEKRNIQALKNSQGHGGDGGRKKRELYYDDEALDDSTPEILEPVYQSAPLDYEELMEAMNQAYPAPYYNPGDNHLEEKRYLGSRSSFTPNPSDYDNLSPAFVDDATALATAADFEQQQQHLLPSAVGELPAYSPLPRGVPRRLESPRYTGGTFASRPRPYGGGLPEEYPYYDGGSSEAPQNPFYSEDEFRCAARLRKLLYYLKKQYYLDNKYIQAAYGRNNNVRY